MTAGPSSPRIAHPDDLRRPFSSLTPLVAFGTYALAWDIFFSPFGAERRVTTALLIATLLFAQNETRES